MAVLVELTIDSQDFDLGRVTAVQDGIHISLERVVPTGGEVMPFFWAEGADFELFEASVRENRIVDDLTAVARVGDRVLYHVFWGDTVSSLTNILTESQATILEAHGNDPWFFRLRFNDHAGLTEFHNLSQAEDIDFHVERIYSLADGETGVLTFDITPEQQEALVVAVEDGYFEVPRQTTLGDVADQLSISPQAASERVRRGADTVLRKVLLSRSAADFE
ncbi:DNA binding domain-containing protein [Haloferax elongans ATCC BAA-1513]|uniref:DNA binding domain-containing protein n=1 Tax=Haloferax elongans ATCC BAA-1513 TaxID=1230453 RepID=M0HBJ7_HALEO|nr:helix-turn-helix domain-containing protein [Haloferax elongans]ELZ81870.1 DNA binding domain-containing protein [Haloferax elongans ATCC BAA-1513]